MILPPEGFVLHDRHSPLTAPWEPIFARLEADRLRLGLEVRTEHTNSRGLLHGGLIAALADNAMGLSVGVRLKAEGRPPERGLVTTSLNVDFLGLAKLGWRSIRPSSTPGASRALRRPSFPRTTSSSRGRTPPSPSAE